LDLLVFDISKANMYSIELNTREVKHAKNDRGMCTVENSKHMEIDENFGDLFGQWNLRTVRLVIGS
jgi:hypothetical protein